tara:strand:- start:5 stop:238 length:234 start_codon:yes stop_codon:yes gene_type:complete
MKIPNIIDAKTDFHGLLLSENGNNQITGQQGEIPFIFNQSGEEIIRAGKKIALKIINNCLLFLAIIFQDLNPIYRLW